MRLRNVAISAVFMFSSIAAAAGELPCVFAEKSMMEEAMNAGLSKPKDFVTCVHRSRVCIVSGEGSVISAQGIQELGSTPGGDPAIFGIVQSPAGETPSLCLAGAYSGGSAAAWMFMGWKVVKGAPFELRSMSEASLDNDAITPRALANAIYQAYKHHGSR